MLEKVRKKGNSPTLLVEIWTGAATVENSMEATGIQQSYSWTYIWTKL